MGALAPVSNWKPEDDLLLRKAVEAGASLESLAKGAVEFSQKYTLNQLKERWHSLLYNPIISAEASSHMFELEYFSPNLPSKFNFNRIGNPKETTTFPTKRHCEKVRSRYYAQHKRMRVEPLEAMQDRDFMVDPDNAGYMGDAEEPPFGNRVLDADALNNFQFEESNLEIINNPFPDNLELIPHASSVDSFHMGRDNEVVSIVPENFSLTGKGCGLDQQMVNQPSQLSEVGDQMVSACSDFEGDQMFNSPIPECGPPVFEDLDYLSPIPPTAKQMTEENPPSDFLLHIATEERDLSAQCRHDGHMRDTSKTNLLPVVPEEPLLDTDCYFAELSHSLFDEEDPFMDGDGQGVMDDSYYDLLFNSSNYVGGGNHENLTAGTEQAGTSVAPGCCEDVSGDAHDMGMNNNEDSFVNVSSGPAWDPHPEIQNGRIICFLNRESDEIPDNNHFAINPTAPSPVFPSEPQNPKVQKSIPASARNLMADKKPEKPPSHSQRITGDPNVVGDCCIGPKLPTYSGLGKSNIAGPRPACKNIDVPLLVLKDVEIGMQNPPVASDSYLKYSRNEICGEKLEEETFWDQQMRSKDVDIAASTFESEEDRVEDDDDLPHYSDVEATILDMDLDPDGQDLFELEVTRYQHEDVKRAIMRLEQSAHSCTKRDIASHGAFAVLYGRYSRHYIKKPNVLLGRATEEHLVDIDIGRAGSKTQVSRRQAVISLKNDGSFHIKNVGKFPISVNETEIGHGKVSSLETNCLIEIRGMPFIFETDKACVKRYLEQHRQQRSAAAN